MDFLAPLMLVGVVGAAVPIALHLIGRRRARRVRFAALDFLLGSDRKLARSLRLREWILLAARVLACVALAGVLAKPYLSCTDHGPRVVRGPQAAVLVIDDGFAAGYVVGGEPLIERARREARRILTQLGPEAEVAVVTASQGAHAPGELSRDHIRLRDQLAGLAPTGRPADLSAALRRAHRLLAASNHASRTLYLISTVPAAALGPDAPWPTGEGPAVVVVDPAGGAGLDNAAVTALDLAADPDAGPRGLRVTAEVVLHGAKPARREVRLELGGQLVARGEVELEPNKPVRKSFSAMLPAGVRTTELVVALAPDALPIDDRRHAIASLRAAIPVLLIDGDPRTVRHDDELFYLATALRPGDRDDSGAEVTTATPDELGDVELDRYDVIALCNVRALPPAVVSRLAAWVKGGGGLWLTVGDHVDAEAWNRSMKPLLPQELATAIDTGFGQAAGERSGRALRLDKLELDHPIFAPFGKDARVLAEARFRKVMLLGPTTEVSGRRVLARFDNGAVALVEAEHGAGRVLLYTSTVDRDWTDLPLQPGFLPMAQQAVRHLAKKPATERRQDLRVGAQVMIDVAPDEERLEVEGPREARTVFEGDALSERRQIRFAATTAPGIYRVFDIDDSGRHERDAAAFAVNLDPRGSDLARAPADAIVGGDGGPSGAGEQAHRRRVELWHAIAAALLLFLLLESALLVRA